MNLVSPERLQIEPPLNDLEISKILSKAKSNLESDGYWVFAAGNTDRSALLKLADAFGTRQGHAKSHPDGIREVTGNSYSQKSGSIK